MAAAHVQDGEKALGRTREPGADDTVPCVLKNKHEGLTLNKNAIQSIQQTFWITAVISGPWQRQ